LGSSILDTAAMDQDAHGLLQAISEDPFLSPFASSEFDCSEFVGAVIAGPQQQYSGGGGQQINAVLWEHQSLEAACEVINNSMHRVDAVIRKHILVNEEVSGRVRVCICVMLCFFNAKLCS
jgi:hypothetical protein